MPRLQGLDPYQIKATDIIESLDKKPHPSSEAYGDLREAIADALSDMETEVTEECALLAEKAPGTDEGGRRIRARRQGRIRRRRRQGG